jgi:hypothetical protein
MAFQVRKEPARCCSLLPGHNKHSRPGSGLGALADLSGEQRCRCSWRRAGCGEVTTALHEDCDCYARLHSFTAMSKQTLSGERSPS